MLIADNDQLTPKHPPEVKGATSAPEPNPFHEHKEVGEAVCLGITGDVG